MSDAEKEKTRGITRRLAKETPYTEELELVQHGSDQSLGVLLVGQVTGQAIWKNFHKDGKLSVWASIKGEGLLR